MIADEREWIRKEIAGLKDAGLYDISLLEVKMLQDRIDYLNNSTEKFYSFKFKALYESITSDDRLKPLHIQKTIETMRNDKYPD